MPYVQSVFIDAVAYDETAHVLTAKFRADGRVIAYENVPQDVYDSLIFANSIAAYFREHIESAYPAHEIQSGKMHKLQ